MLSLRCKKISELIKVICNGHSLAVIYNHRGVIIYRLGSVFFFFSTCVCVLEMVLVKKHNKTAMFPAFILR